MRLVSSGTGCAPSAKTTGSCRAALARWRCCTRIRANCRQAEVAGDLLKKGRLIYADGRMQTRSWDTEDGKKHFMTEVVVDSLQIIGPKPGDSPA